MIWDGGCLGEDDIVMFGVSLEVLDIQAFEFFEPEFSSKDQ